MSVNRIIGYNASRSFHPKSIARVAQLLITKLGVRYSSNNDMKDRPSPYLFKAPYEWSPLALQTKQSRVTRLAYSCHEGFYYYGVQSTKYYYLVGLMV